MQILEVHGNLLNARSGHIIHGCNAQGVMGKGLAKSLRESYPTVYTTYRNIHEEKGLECGTAIPVFINSKLVIWNLITQETYGSAGRYISYDHLEKSLDCMNNFIDRDIFSFYDVPKIIHTPKIGCNNAGGDWTKSKEILTNKLSSFDEVIVWEFNND